MSFIEMTGTTLERIIAEDELHQGDLVEAGVEASTIVRVNRQGDIEVRRHRGWDVIGGNPLYVFGPKGMPDAAVKAVHDAFKKGIETDQFKKFAGEKSLSVDYKGPDALASELQRDAARYGQLVKKLGLGNSK